jgi:molecular chaperone GrpE
MTDSVPNSEATNPKAGAAGDMDDSPEGVTAAPAGDQGAARVETGEEGAAPISSPEDAGEAEMVALREEFETLNDRHLRLAAEFNNYRRRVEQERAEIWSRAQAELVGKLVDVLDDLQRVAALDLGDATVEAIMEGIDLVDRKFVRKLEEAGVEVVDPAGEAFNPETMEAMIRVPVESQEDDDRVAQVFQKGYTLKGILVRPARVSVLKLG